MASSDGSTTTTVSVDISFGEVRGTTTSGIDRYLGIPYAAAPVGENRFALPVPPQPWQAPFAAAEYGPTAPQSAYGGALARILPTVTIAGDDFLNLNVWAPAAETREGLLPVIVWIHGGSLKHGSNALQGYDGTTFARDGVVFVAPNYRLGAEGFSVLEGAPLNLGLADQFAALRWVQAEIERFGGDPRRVTVCGQSAGGNTISALLAHPDAAALFAQAIIQSGPLTARPAASAGKITRLIAQDLKISATRDAFLAVPPDELVAAQSRVTAGSTPLTGGAGYALAIDPQLVPVVPQRALESGRGDAIPLLIGTTTEESRLWLVPTGLSHKLRALHLAVARLKFGISAATVRLYKKNRPGEGSGDILGALATDLLLRVPAARLADARRARGASTHVYEFSWQSPVERLGAAHAVELGFVFDGVKNPDSLSLAGPDAPQDLATAMHSAWVNFVVTGDPGWPLWDETRPVRDFDGAANPVVLAPREQERVALEGAAAPRA